MGLVETKLAIIPGGGEFDMFDLDRLNEKFDTCALRFQKQSKSTTLCF